MSVFHRSTDGFEQSEPNRREVLLAAGGLAAATAIAANGGHAATSHVGDKKRPALPHLTVTITDTRLNATFEGLAYSWGASNAVVTTGGGSGVGRANVQDLSLTKYVDASTPRLFSTLVTGRHLQRVVVTWVGSAGAPTVVVTMDDVLITSLSEGGSADEQRLTENLTFNFRKVEVAYDDVRAGFDIARNQSF